MFLGRCCFVAAAIGRFGLLTRKKLAVKLTLPAFSEKLLEPPRKPTDHLTEKEISNFDSYYRKRRIVEQVNVNANKPMMKFRVEKRDVWAILAAKIKTPGQLVDFIKQRGTNMKPLEVKFCLSLFTEHQVEVESQVIEIMENALLAADKIPFEDSKGFLEFAVSNEPQNEQLVSMLATTYLSGVSSSAGEVLDCELLLNLPESIFATSRKTIVRLSKRRLETGIQLLCQLCENLTEEEAKNYDKWLVGEFGNLTQQQRIKILEAFSRSNRKGIFVELMRTTTLEQPYQPASITELVQIAVLLTKLNELEEHSFEELEQKLLPFLQNRQFNETDLKLSIQLSHHNCAGSLEFWRLLHKLYTGDDYSQKFAILGGYERNHHTDAALFVSMIMLDPSMQALELNNENDFLKLMLVYHRNVSKLQATHTHKQVIVERLKAKLLEVYRTRPFKIFTMLFLWLLQSTPAKKDEYFKLIYSRPDEKELFDIMLDPTTSNQTSQTARKLFDYYEVDPLRCALEIFIRKRKTEFDRKN